MKNKKNTGQVVSSSQIDSVELQKDNDISKIDGVEGCEEMSGKPEKNTKKQKNLAKENINTSNNNLTMNDKSDNGFDKLYQSLMEADELPTMDDDMFGDEPSEEPEGFGNEEEGGAETVTLDLPKDLAEQLHQALMDQLEPSGDEELEDLDSGDDLEDPFASGGDSPLEDSIQVVAEPQSLADSKMKSGNNSSMDNKPATSGYGKSDGGKASGGDIPEPQGDPSELKDTSMKKGNNSSMDNKVNAPGYNTGEYIK